MTMSEQCYRTWKSTSPIGMYCFHRRCSFTKVSRLASEIYNVISSQTKTEKTAACFQETVQNQFEKLHSNMVERQTAQSQYRQWHEEAHQVVVEHLGNMSAD